MAYYSNEGTQIHTAAAGLGAMPGPLMSFKDGSLGQPAVRAYREGSLGLRPVRAYKDGSLGSLGACPGPSMAFQDGVLGSYSGKLMSFRDGVLGQSPPELPVLDMRDPAVVKEIKTVMAMVPFMLPYMVGDNQVADFGGDALQGFLDDPLWDDRATLFADTYLKALVGFLQQSGQSVNPEEVRLGWVAPSLYPNAGGVATIMFAAQSYMPAEDAQALFASIPKLSDFFAKSSAIAAAATVPAGTVPNFDDYGTVIPPEGAAPPGSDPVLPAPTEENMLVWGGIAAATLVAAVFAFRK